MTDNTKPDGMDFFQTKEMTPPPETTEADQLQSDHKQLYTMLGNSIKLNNEQIAKTLQCVIGLCIDRVEGRLNALDESASI